MELWPRRMLAASARRKPDEEARADPGAPARGIVPRPGSAREPGGDRAGPCDHAAAHLSGMFADPRPNHLSLSAPNNAPPANAERPHASSRDAGPFLLRTSSFRTPSARRAAVAVSYQIRVKSGASEAWVRGPAIDPSACKVSRSRMLQRDRPQDDVFRMVAKQRLFTRMWYEAFSSADRGAHDGTARATGPRHERTEAQRARRRPPARQAALERRAAALPGVRRGRGAAGVDEDEGALPHLRPADGARRARLLPGRDDVQHRARRGDPRHRAGGGDDRPLAGRALAAAGDRRAGDDGGDALRLLPLLAARLAGRRPPPAPPHARGARLAPLQRRGRDAPLRLSRGLSPSHAAMPRPRVRAGGLRAVVAANSIRPSQPAVRGMLDAPPPYA